MVERKFLVTCGDVAGSSPWLLKELVEDRSAKESMVILGPASLRGFLLEKSGKPHLDSRIEWIETGNVESSEVISGEPTAKTGEVAYRAVKRALKLSRRDVDGLLTLPLSKAAVKQGGYDTFVGHTEMLEDHFDTRGTMTFFGDSMTVALVTRHCSIARIPSEISREKIMITIRTVADFFRDNRGLDPSIALLGLNPHAGEDGRMGTEDRDLLEPAITDLRSEGFNVEGPYPADSFIPVHGESVDVIVACYHDQGLVPFKQNHFFDGVHSTLGLPILRVSPDHGIAAEQASNGEVDPRSTLNCLKWLRESIDTDAS